MDINNFQPINGRILIEVLPDTATYDGAIVRLDAGQEKSNLAIVKAVDEEYTGGVLHIKIGDTVMYNKHSGTIIKIDRFDDNQPEYRVLKYDDIFGIIRNGDSS